MLNCCLFIVVCSFPLCAGIAEACAPHELLYWTRDLDGVSFGVDTTAAATPAAADASVDASGVQLEDVESEKDDDNPDLTWTESYDENDH